MEKYDKRIIDAYINGNDIENYSRRKKSLKKFGSIEFCCNFASSNKARRPVRLVGLGRKIFILEIRGSNPLRGTKD